MLKKDFWYDLPKELIAQEPAEPRDAARLMVLDRHSDAIRHAVFHDLPQYLEKGDLLVVNNSKVLPARLLGTKVPTGAVCELLLLRQGELLARKVFHQRRPLPAVEHVHDHQVADEPHAHKQHRLGPAVADAVGKAGGGGRVLFAQAAQAQQAGGILGRQIAVMHHHYLPTCYVEDVAPQKPGSVVYDANRLMAWMNDYNVRILLHGHKHVPFAAMVEMPSILEQNCNFGNGKYVYIIGMGSTCVPSSSGNVYAKICFLRDSVNINFYKLSGDNSEQDRLERTITIPI